MNFKEGDWIIASKCRDFGTDFFGNKKIDCSYIDYPIHVVKVTQAHIIYDQARYSPDKKYIMCFEDLEARKFIVADPALIELVEPKIEITANVVQEEEIS